MVNQMAMDIGVSLGQLKDIEDLIPDMLKVLLRRWKLFWINPEISHMLT